jgi:hypothetical protein
LAEDGLTSKEISGKSRFLYYFGDNPENVILDPKTTNHFTVTTRASGSAIKGSMVAKSISISLS